MGQDPTQPSSLRDVLGSMSLSDLLAGVSSDALLAGVSRPTPTAEPTPFDQWAQGAHRFGTRLGEPSLLPDPMQQTARPGPLAEPPPLRQIPRRDKFTDFAMDYLFRSVPSRPEGPSVFDPWYEKAADVVYPTLLEVGGGILGTLGGSAVGDPLKGGAVGMGGGNVLAQEYQQRRGLRDEGSPLETAIATGFGMLPAIGPEGSTIARNLAKRGAQNWAAGATEAQARATLEGHPLSATELIEAGALSGIMGAALSPLEVSAARRMAGQARYRGTVVDRATPGQLDQLAKSPDESTRVAAVTEILRRQREQASPGTVLRMQAEEPVVPTPEVPPAAPRAAAVAETPLPHEAAVREMEDRLKHGEAGEELPPPARAVAAERPSEPAISGPALPEIVMPPPAGRPSKAQIAEGVPYRGLKLEPLPKSLAAITPEIVGQKVTFESPLDRAAYLLTQPKLAKSHSDALAYIQQMTGLDEAAARQYGTEVATRLQEVSARGQPTAAPMKTARVFAPMPRDIAGAKSRYGYRDRNFLPKFENPIDHAAYITAQKKPSPRDADYLRYAMEQTGLDAAGVRAHGARVREAMKPLAKTAYAGTEDEFVVPSVWRAESTKQAPSVRPRGGLRLPAGTPPRPVLPSMTAQELLARLQVGDQLLPTPPASDLPPDWAREVKQIGNELREFGFERGAVDYDPAGAVEGSGWTDSSASRMAYQSQASHPNLLRNTPGAPVFHDIMQGRAGNRASVGAAIDKYQAGGTPTALVDRTLNVAQRRLLRDRTVKGSALPREGPISPPPGTNMAAFLKEFGQPTPEALAFLERVKAEGDALGDQLEARFGKVYNGDDASKLLMGIDDAPHPEAWQQHYDNVRAAATELRDQTFARRMAQPKVNEDEVVAVTSGGTGSGKGTYIEDLKPNPGVVAVLDSTLSNKEKAVTQIGQILESGRDVALRHIWRDPIEAFREGVIPRFLQTGRPVPIPDHVRTHTQAAPLFLELADLFGGRSNVDVMVQHNMPDGQSVDVSLEWLREQASRYNDPDALAAQLRAVLADELASGRIDSQQAYALGARAGDFAAARRIRESQYPQGVRAGAGPETVGGAAAGEAPAADRGPGQPGSDVGGGAAPPPGGEGPPRPPGGDEPPPPPPPPPEGEGPLPPPGTEGRTPRGARAARYAHTVGDEDIPSQRPLGKARIEGEQVFLKKTPEYIRDELEEILDHTHHYAGQRRGEQPMERSEELGRHLEVERRHTNPKGTTYNAEEFAAVENALTSTMGRVNELSELIRSGKATSAEKGEHMKAFLETMVIFQNYIGARAEAGRALNMLKRYKWALNAFGEDNGAGLDELIREAQRNGLDPRDLATTWLGLTSDVDKMKYLRSLNTPKTMDWIKGVMYSGILSGPATHMRNFFGNTTNLVLRNAAMAPALGYDVARSTVTGTPRTIYAGEMKPRAVGAAVGALQGLKDGVFVLRNGFAKRDLGTFDITRKELPSPTLRMFRKGEDQSWGQYVKGLTPNQWRGDPTYNPLNWVGRALEFSDQFFYSVAYNMDLYSRLYAHAEAQGIPKELWPAKMTEWKASPPARIRKAAEQTALEAVFKEKGGKLVEGIVHLKAEVPLMDFVFPFARTPGNLMRQGFEMTPAAVFSPHTRAKFAGQDIPPGDTARIARNQAEMFGRMVTGTAALATLAYYVGDRISGTGPKDPDERAALMRKGWKPNSVRLWGNLWVPFTDIVQPLSQPLFAIANAFDKYRTEGKVDPMHVAAAAGASLLDQSFFAGVSDLNRALSDDERYAEQFFQRWTQSLMPFSGLQRNITQAIDPVVREPAGVVEGWKSIIPGLSTSVKPKIGTLGEEITRQGSAFERGFSPIKRGWTPDDPIVQKLAALGIDNLGLPPKTLQPTAQYPEITLSVAERQQLGQANRAALERLFARPQFDSWNPGRQREEMKDALRRARAEVAEQIRRAHQQAARR